MAKRCRVTLDEQARAQIKEIAAWRGEQGQRNRAAIEELRDALKALAAFPDMGVTFRSRVVRGPRRLLLPRSQYWIYYEVDRASSVVHVLAVWRTSRGKAPPLR